MVLYIKRQPLSYIPLKLDIKFISRDERRNVENHGVFI